MPRYDRYQKVVNEMRSTFKSGSVALTWDKSGTFATFPGKDGKTVRFDLATGKLTPTEEAAAAGPPARPGGRRRGAPQRGRQNDHSTSGDDWVATAKERNVYVKAKGASEPVQLTTDGSVEKRIKYGTASWVYGEELGVSDAMWWSPDNQYLAFYRFDEAEVKDFYLGLDQTKVQSTLDQEPYPKAGAPNPKVNLLVYDRTSKKLTTIDCGPADGIGHYVYDVRWAPKGGELLFNRTNRKQNELDVCAVDPKTAKVRVIFHEEWKKSWVQNHPPMTFLEDNYRFILTSERTGFKNYYLMDLSGKLISTITKNDFDADEIVRVDEKTSTLWYASRTAENPYLRQLHRVKLDGNGDTLITDPQLSHRVTISPDGKWYADIAESVTNPPQTRILDAKGKVVHVIGESDLSEFDSKGYKRVERFTFLAADDKTTCYGKISFPSDFDPKKKYPVVVSVYGGPESSGGVESFALPDATTEYGFIAVTMDGRGTNGRGKAFKDAVYRNLGVVEIDDHAAGMRELAKRPYIDGKRVGIHGTSYGGYFSCMALLRHPEAFQVAVASSAVTKWDNYDTIYTERYMDIPQDNPEGYKAGSAMEYAKNCGGKLLLFYGTADNNVHPNNTLQLVQALNRAGKRYEMQVGPDQGHSGVSNARTWEYFITHLILRPVKVEAVPITKIRQQAPKGR